MYIYIAFIIAYLLGSFPTAVVVGKLFYRTDVRSYGSKNPGATNTLRVLGKKAAIIVLILDILKGFIATKLVLWMPFNLYETNIGDAQLLCGLFAILGHILPIFLKFKGGKGIATCFGVALSLYFTVSVITLASFILIVSLTRYVSLGSIIAVIIFSTLSISLGSEKTILEKIFFIAISFTVLFTHRKNILSLLKCQENKISFKKK